MDTPYSARPAQAPVGEQVFREVTLNTFNVGFTVNMSGDTSTSANFGTILAAESGYRWFLDGGYLHAVVISTLAGAAAEGIMHLQDGTTVSSASIILPIAHYEASNAGARSAVGTVLTQPQNGAPLATNPDRGGVMSFSFARSPSKALAVGNGLFIRGSHTIGLGVIRVTGCVWGWKEVGSP